MAIPGVVLRGSLFRAIPLAYLTTPLSAVGSLLRGGRYNPKGDFEAFYLAESPDTTLYEIRAIAPATAPRRLNPTVTFTVDVVLQHTVDLTSTTVQASLGITPADLQVEWKDLVDAGTIPLTHDIGHAARDTDVEAIRVPSARQPGAANLVIIADRLRIGSSIVISPSHGFPAGTQITIAGSHTPP